MEVKGWFSYKGITTQQHENVYNVFKQFFLEVKPKRIMEIGTAYGGLTLIIRDILDEIGLYETEVLSYDVVEKHFLKKWIESGKKIDVKITNLFNKQYSELIEIKEVESFIKKEGTTIVICDGGSKKNEFRLLSNLLKESDIIMAHDYSPNENFFEENIKNKIWNWLEIKDSDIIESCVINNLISFMEKEFTDIVWVCKIKK